MQTCSIDGCGKQIKARSLCRFHYQRWLRGGDPLKIKRRENGIAIDYIESVALSHSSDDCLYWPFYVDAQGRASITINKKPKRVARVICEMVHGVPPDDRPEAAHSCGNGHLGCISPKHLRWANHSENMIDRIQHGTHNRGERHPEAKLSEADIVKIRQMRGILSQRKIAKMFDISPGHVSDIQTRKTWFWLP
ncbi:hypothetical protein PUR29_14170 [Methylobacterium ajmalii]|uniref:HNH nuclease domain-containing protein n=1 Tax=Methylobacterium ajmalii TaxID=2738439 RepID=A0ABU9ZTB5_9HYPH